MSRKDKNDDAWQVWGVQEALAKYLEESQDSLDDQLLVIRWIAGLGESDRRTAGIPVPGVGAPVLCASVPTTNNWVTWCPDNERHMVVLLDIENPFDEPWGQSAETA